MSEIVLLMTKAAFESAHGPWELLPDEGRFRCIDEMEAALAALSAAGFVVVPREPDAVMIAAGEKRDAWYRHRATAADHYRAMVDAYKPTGG